MSVVLISWLVLPHVHHTIDRKKIDEAGKVASGGNCEYGTNSAANRSWPKLEQTGRPSAIAKNLPPRQDKLRMADVILAFFVAAFVRTVL